MAQRTRNLDDKVSKPVRLYGMDTRRGIRAEGTGSLLLNLHVAQDGLLHGVGDPGPFFVSLNTGEPLTYTTLTGVFVGQAGKHEVALVQEGGELKRRLPWTKTWQTLESGLQSSPQGPPMQFVRTQTGVVILPQTAAGTYPRFYDGETYAPLGYTQAPPAAQVLGPKSTSPYDDASMNVAGIVRMGGVLNRHYQTGGVVAPRAQSGDWFGTGALGTVEVNPAATDSTGPAAGLLLSGEWYLCVQFINKWGHLSPKSSISAPFRLDQKKPTASSTSLDDLRQNCYWRVPVGPPGTIGRVLSRTKDTINSPTGSTMFEIRVSAGSTGQAAFATIPDNVTTLFYDNVGDGSLLTPSDEVIPVPSAVVVAFTMGRLWLGTADGRIHYSALESPGTFRRNDFVTVSSIPTGFAATAEGLIVYTETEATLITERPEAAAFVVRRIPASVGCVAPRSIQTLPDGTTIWLAPRGFYAYVQGQQGATFVGAPVQYELIEFAQNTKSAVAVVDPATGSYICWVNIRGNITGFQFTPGAGWNLRTDTAARDVCAWEDTFVVAGRNPAGEIGLWVPGRGQYAFGEAVEKYTQQYILRTEWRNSDDMSQVTAWHVDLESHGAEAETVTVRTYRDGSVAVPEAYHEVSLTSVDNGSDIGRWGDIVWGEGYWEAPPQNMIKADLGSHNVRVYAVELETDQPPIWGLISFGDNKNIGGVK